MENLKISFMCKNIIQRSLTLLVFLNVIAGYYVVITGPKTILTELICSLVNVSQVWPLIYPDSQNSDLSKVTK